MEFFQSRLMQIHCLLPTVIFPHDILAKAFGRHYHIYPLLDTSTQAKSF